MSSSDDGTNKAARILECVSFVTVHRTRKDCCDHDRENRFHTCFECSQILQESASLCTCFFYNYSHNIRSDTQPPRRIYDQLDHPNPFYRMIRSLNNHLPFVDFSVLSASGGFSMLLKQDGSLWATGNNMHGQFGDNSTDSRKKFVKVVPSDVQSVVVGGAHSMMLTSGGNLWGTGGNVHGQLGDERETTKTTFVYVFSNVQTVSSNVRHTMLVRQRGGLFATGDNTHGQLGLGEKSAFATEFRGVIDSGVQTVAAGGDHSVVVKKDGSLWTTGSNADGQLGIGKDTIKVYWFTKAVDSSGVKVSGAKVAFAGARQSMVVKTDGRCVVGWGGEGNG